MAIETIGGIPTRGETYAKMMHHLREAQECAAIMSHLHNTEGSHKDKIMARGWLHVEDLIKKMAHNITKLAQGALQ